MSVNNFSSPIRSIASRTCLPIWCLYATLYSKIRIPLSLPCLHLPLMFPLSISCFQLLSHVSSYSPMFPLTLPCFQLLSHVSTYSPMFPVTPHKCFHLPPSLYYTPCFHLPNVHFPPPPQPHLHQPLLMFPLTLLCSADNMVNS